MSPGIRSLLAWGGVALCLTLVFRTMQHRDDDRARAARRAVAERLRAARMPEDRSAGSGPSSPENQEMSDESVREALSPSESEVPAVESVGRILHGIVIRAYCPCTVCCGRKADGCVSWGGRRIPVTYNPKWLALSDDLREAFPFGTTITIPGMGDWTVADATRGDRISQIEILFTDRRQGYIDAHSTAHHFPTFKGLLYQEGGKGRVDHEWPKVGEPFPWDRAPWIGGWD